MIHVHEVLERGVDRHLMLCDLLLAEIFGLTEGLGVEDGTGAQLKSLEPLVGIGDVLSVEHDAVVLHNDSLVVRVLLELGDYLLS